VEHHHRSHRAFIGSFVFGALGLGAYGFLGSVIVAFIGALILIWLLGALRHAPA
jgi:uncharacterized membrane protein YeaQ/YmgE (transglycosylase-associated protein family)